MTLLEHRGRWKQLSPLLDEVLDLAPVHVAERVAQVHADDPALAQDLSRILSLRHRGDADRVITDRLGRPAAWMASQGGRRIGRYVLGSLLGEGAAGSVWSANCVMAGTPQHVAVKLLHPSLIGRTGDLRFQREGDILARLAHPNIARLLESGITADKQPYLALEFVDGLPIDAYCDANRLDLRARVGLFLQVLAAVEHAHRSSVLHRDLKPSNIHVTRGGTVKLLDFGIAKIVGAAATLDANITLTGLRVLTPQSAAPEQLQGGALSPSTDVYALGVLLFKLLASRHPTSQGADTSAQVMNAILHQAAMPLRLSWSQQRGTQELAGIAAQRGMAPDALLAQLDDPCLGRIVARALAKEPASRHQRVAELASDLRDHLANDVACFATTSRLRVAWPPSVPARPGVARCPTR